MFGNIKFILGEFDLGHMDEKDLSIAFTNIELNNWFRMNASWPVF